MIQEADILEFFTENYEKYGNDFHTQDSLTSPRSDDDIEGDISRKETSLKELKVLITKNNQDELKHFYLIKIISISYMMRLRAMMQNWLKRY
ncbi:putative tRNA pseudouridine synthase D [Rickettsia endosymbiont of Ixodes pacificus]|uniref:hypothetical protein n=1 Tax=Rickettsia endosymbiont of Ixodes pacificus TaxID=1133329 RepID=UPI0005F7F3E0|nr:hypothetical protein [Rickettsia endosymbiont of Ixodes pacificus]KJW03515.1 putative tRNA pseudouridine synthase D [Rickettsia endosymbiont of Ixodes pacificus]